MILRGTINTTKMITLEQNPAIRQYLKQYEILAKAQCAPLIWTDENDIYEGGTMTFLRTSKAILGITNRHVADGMEKHVHRSDVVFQLGAARFDPKRLIQKHPDLDLATYELSDVLLATTRHQAASVRSWPIEKPNEDDTLFMGGWPGSDRQRKADGSLDLPFSWIAARIGGEPGRYISVEPNMEDRTAISDQAMQPIVDFGGWSGGGVYRYVGEEQGSTIEYLELCGIVAESHESGYFVMAHDLTSLNEDGTFDR